MIGSEKLVKAEKEWREAEVNQKRQPKVSILISIACLQFIQEVKPYAITSIQYK